MGKGHLVNQRQYSAIFRELRKDMGQCRLESWKNECSNGLLHFVCCPSLEFQIFQIFLISKFLGFVLLHVRKFLQPQICNCSLDHYQIVPSYALSYASSYTPFYASSCTPFYAKSYARSQIARIIVEP